MTKFRAFIQRMKIKFRTFFHGPQITTIYGVRTESDFSKEVGGFENDNEKTSWVEYRDFDGTLVHRSANVQLKKWPEQIGASVGAIR